jgi:hypothetical protein
MSYPDNINLAALADHIGDSPRALAYENAIEREYNDLLFNLTNDYKPEGSQFTAGQKFIDELVGEQELDGTLYAAIRAAAKHLQSRKSITPEQVGQALIDALAKDLDAIAENRAEDE